MGGDQLSPKDHGHFWDMECSAMARSFWELIETIRGKHKRKLWIIESMPLRGIVGFGLLILLLHFQMRLLQC